MESLIQTLMQLGSSVVAVFAIGFLIFIHELGHFLAAKYYGVRCDVFSIGFGPALYKFTLGETEYRLGALPLGGYVLMLGADTEMPSEQNSDDEGKQDTTATYHGASDDPALTDPRSFVNKSVGARMVIMSAGVVMNLLLGFVILTFLATMPRVEQPAELRIILPGRPAYEAGLLAGDRVVAINGEENISFSDLERQVGYASVGNSMQFRIARPSRGEAFDVTLAPRRLEKSDRPTIGVMPTYSLLFDPSLSIVPTAGLADQSAAEDVATEDESDEQFLIVGVRVDDEDQALPVNNRFELDRLLDRYADQPIRLVLEPLTDDELDAQDMLDRMKSGESPYPTDPSAQTEVVLPPSPFVDFGILVEALPIQSLRAGFPAARAGFEVGDRILAVDGDENYDPLRLPSYCSERADQEIEFTLRREGEAEPITLTARPNDTPPWIRTYRPHEQNVQAIFKNQGVDPLDVTGLGLCYHVVPRIKAVRPNSPAERAGLKPGELITYVTVNAPTVEPEQPLSEWATRKLSIATGPDSPGFANAFLVMQTNPITEIELTIEGRDDPVTLDLEPVEGWWFPQRGLFGGPESMPVPGLPLSQAVVAGAVQTLEDVTLIYRVIQGMLSGQLSTRMFSGPVGIFDVVIKVSENGFLSLLKVMAVISINLAVFNFLPIPPFDGGRMVYLIGEKIIGRPLPDSVVQIGLRIGLIFVLGLFVLVFYQDIYRQLSRFFDI